MINMPVLRKRQFMADITVCNSQMITGEVAIFGNGLPRAAARRKTIARLEKIRRDRLACLFEITGKYYDGKGIYSDRTDAEDDGTKIHEEFHAEVAALMIPSVGKWADPIEESAAYAYEDFAMLQRGTDSTADWIRLHRLQAKYSVRFIVGTDNPELSRMRATAIGFLRRTGTAIAGDGTAIAFSYAENFICYIECLAALRKWGEVDGKKILFDAIRESGHLGLENSRRFLLAQLPKIVQEDINESYGIDPAKLRLRPLHHQEYECEELGL